MSEPLVSIGIPVYNGEEFLEECLDSILSQSYSNWDCVVVNNQSKDGTVAVAEKFVKKDKRFRLMTNPEFVDMNTNFNNAFKYASKGKYFKVICADDWIFPNFLESMVALLEAHPQAGFCSSYRIDNRIVNCAGLNIYDGPLFNGKEILRMQLLQEMDDILGSETTLLMRTEVLEKLPEFPILYSNKSYHFDTSLAYELLSMSDICFVFQVLSYTRRSEQTFTSQYTNRFSTHFSLREQELFKYKVQMPELESRYKIIREKYGLFLLKRKWARDKESIEWHKKWLPKERRFSGGELLIIAMKTGISRIFKRSSKR